MNAANTDQFYSGARCTAGVFAGLVGVSVRTLQRWDESGKLRAGRLPSGRRFYAAEHYRLCGGDPGEFERLVSKQGGGGGDA